MPLFFESANFIVGKFVVIAQVPKNHDIIFLSGGSN